MYLLWDKTLKRIYFANKMLKWLLCSQSSYSGNMIILLMSLIINFSSSSIHFFLLPQMVTFLSNFVNTEIIKSKCSPAMFKTLWVFHLNAAIHFLIKTGQNSNYKLKERRTDRLSHFHSFIILDIQSQSIIWRPK